MGDDIHDFEHAPLDTLFKAKMRATYAGFRSPCQKSKRGVVVFNREIDDYFVGWNTPPKGFPCTGSEACKAACGRLCIHAEQMALMEVLKFHQDLSQWEMLHVKVEGNEAVPSSGPSCVDCSKLILFCGLKAMWLYEDRGDGPPLPDGTARLRGALGLKPLSSSPKLYSYTAEEFHRETLKNLGLNP